MRGRRTRDLTDDGSSAADARHIKRHIKGPGAGAGRVRVSLAGPGWIITGT
jgi:hypothetical protein